MLSNRPASDVHSPLQQQVKRVFKAKSVINALASRRNLHLEEGLPRKRSEVQMYMILYYDTRIREVVVKRWAEDRVECMEFGAEVNVPESDIDPQDSFILKDPKIPIAYKTAIARNLYAAESEVIKAEVRTQREAWQPGGKTVRTDDEDERLALVEEIQK